MKKILLVAVACGSLWAQMPISGTPGTPASGPGSGTVSLAGCGLALSGTGGSTLSSTGDCYVAGGGSADAQTATYSPAATLTAGFSACWLPIAANATTTPTFAPNGLTAHTIVKAGGSALVANDLTTTAIACAIYNTTGTRWELQNPQTVSGGAGGVYFAPSSASGTTYSGAGSPVPTAYAAGMQVAFYPDVAGSGGATTVNISSLGVKSVKRADCSTNPVSTDLVAGIISPLIYNGTVFCAVDLISDLTKNGTLILDGVTSGGIAFSVSNVAGTATTLIWPSTGASTGQVLTDNGTVTCPTLLPSTAPATCRALIWATPSTVVAVDPTGFTPNGGLGGGNNFTISPAAVGQMRYSPLIIPPGGYTFPAMNFLSNSGGHHMTMCFYSLAGNLLTNGQGTTVVIPGNAVTFSITVSSFTATAGSVLLGMASDDTGDSLYAGAGNDTWASAMANVGLASPVVALGPAGSNLATGTTTMTCPATTGTRTAVGVAQGFPLTSYQ